MDINLKKSPDIYESEKALKFYLIDHKSCLTSKFDVIKNAPKTDKNRGFNQKKATYHDLEKTSKSQP